MSRRLLASYVTLALVVLVALEVPLGLAYAHSQRNELRSRLERDARSVGSLAEDALQTGRDIGRLKSVVLSFQRDEDGRAVIVDRTGRTVVGETDDGAAGIAGALANRVVTGSSDGSLYVAVPVSSSGHVHGAVQMTAPLSQIDAKVRDYVLRLLVIAAGVIALVVIVGWLIARSVSRPLRALERAAERAGGGDLSVRAPAAEGPPEVRSLADAFNDMVSRLAELVAVQEEFVADASHQLRTPLTALRLRLENGDVQGALAEVDRLARIVDSLLALARAEAAPPVTVDLEELVADRLVAWEPVAREREIRLEADVDGWARVSPDRLAQVLDNLLANALAAAPSGSAVTVSGDAGGLHVRDAGPGMSEEGRARAFDRFWSKGRGSGLGLPIVKRLVTVDGGSVELRAAPGGGLDVVLTLRSARAPVRRAEARSR